MKKAIIRFLEWRVAVAVARYAYREGLQFPPTGPKSVDDWKKINKAARNLCRARSAWGL